MNQQAVLAASFPLSGVVTTMLGPLLPALIARWSMGDSQAGRFLLAQFLASTAGAVSSAWFMARLGAAAAIGGAYALMGLAVLALGWASSAEGMVCVAAYGFALGVSIPAINLVAAQSAPGREVAQLNVLNLAWCCGAIAAAPCIVVLLRLGGLPAVLETVCGLCLLAAAVCAVSLRPAIRRKEAKARFRVGKTAVKTAIAVGFFLFLYDGVENGLNGWLTVFAQRKTASGDGGLAAILSAFWIGILAGRLITAAAAARLSARRWIGWGLALALLGVSLILAASSPPLLLTGALCAGFGLGPVFPTAVAMFQERTGEASAQLIGLVFAAGGCGGGALPWAIGAVSSARGSLRSGLATMLAAIALMFATLALSRPGLAHKSDRDA